MTGHSLGGCQATLAGLDIKEKLKPATPITITTFGQPRLGNKAFSDYVDSLFPEGTYYRVIHTNDDVGQYPPAYFGYLHQGLEVWYDNDEDLGHYKVCPGDPESPSCQNSLREYEHPPHLQYLGLNLCYQCTAYPTML